MTGFHETSGIRFEQDVLVVGIDGQEMRFDLRTVYPARPGASEAARITYQVSSSGYGIHCP